MKTKKRKRCSLLLALLMTISAPMSAYPGEIEVSGQIDASEEELLLEEEPQEDLQEEAQEEEEAVSDNAEPVEEVEPESMLFEEVWQVEEEAEGIASGITGDVNWCLQEDGRLTFTPVEDSTGMMGTERDWLSEEYIDRIKTVEFAEGVQLNPDSSYLFAGAVNLESVAGTEYVDTSEVTSMQGMFLSCTSLAELYLPEWKIDDTVNTEDIVTGCENLARVITYTKTGNEPEYRADLTFDSLEEAERGVEAPTQRKMRKAPIRKASSSGTVMLSFSGNGGTIGFTGSMFISVPFGEPLGANMDMLPSARRSGYKFTGWYHNDEKVTADTVVNERPFMLYAGWLRNDEDYGTAEGSGGEVGGSGGEVEESGDEVDESGVSGGVTWKLYSSGLLYFYPTNGASGKMGEDAKGSDITANNIHLPWLINGNKDKIKTVEFDNGITLNKYSNCLFYEAENLETVIGAERLDTSEVEDMRWIFNGCKKLRSLDTSTWDTSNVTSMRSMFWGCNQLVNLDVSNWNTSKVTEMKSVFNGCNALIKLDVSNWDTSKVTGMEYTFLGCSSLKELDVSNWDTGSVTTMYETFYQCTALTKLDVSKWNTENVTTLFLTFGTCKALKELDVRDWNVKKVENLEATFQDCAGITSLDLSKWEVGATVNGTATNITIMRNMLRGMTSLKEVKFGPKWNTSKVTNMSGLFSLSDNLERVDLSYFDTSQANMDYIFASCNSLKEIKVGSGFKNKFSSNLTPSNVVDYNGNHANGTWYATVNGTKNYQYSSLTSIPDNKANTYYSVKQPAWTYKGTSGGVTWEYYKADKRLYFYPTNHVSGKMAASQSTGSTGNTADFTFDAGSTFWPWRADNIVNGVKDGVTNLKDSIEVIEFDKGIILNENNRYLFFNLNNLKNVIGEENLDTSQAKDMVYMFYHCVSMENLDVGNWDVSNVTNFSYMFSYCKNLTELDVSNWNVSKVESFDYIFSECIKLKWVDVSKWDTSSATTMKAMFDECNVINNIDVSGFKTNNVKFLDSMFYGCYELTKLDVSEWNLENAVSLYHMFRKCQKLTDLDVSKWDTSKVTDMEKLFCECSSLEEIDISKWDVKNTLRIRGMFYGCTSLKSLDFSKWETLGINNMYQMFYGANELTEVSFGEKWNTSQVTSMTELFKGCSSLQKVDLSYFDTNNVTGMKDMFAGCNQLAEIKVGTGFKKVTTGDYAFTDLAPSSTYINGADGKWHTLNNSTVYALTEIPDNVADTYYAVLPARGDLAGGISWNLDKTTGVLRIYPTDGQSGTMPDYISASDVPWLQNGNKDAIKKVTFDPGIRLAEQSGYLFFGASNLESVTGIDNLDVSHVSSLESMFQDCAKLSSIDISSWNTEHVTNMKDMLTGCKKLSEITVGENFVKPTGEGALTNLVPSASDITGAAGKWYAVQDDQVTGYDLSTIPDRQAMTYHAAVPATVTFETDGGTLPNNVPRVLEVYYGQPISKYLASNWTLPTATRRMGSSTITSTGWTMGFEQTPVTKDTIVSEKNMVVYAAYPSTRADMVITNKVTGSGGDKTKQFSIKVTFSNPSGSSGAAYRMPTVIEYSRNNGTTGQLTVTNGTIQFTLSHGEMITLYQIPKNLHYAITEDTDGYTFTSTNQTGDGIPSTTIVLENSKEAVVPTGADVDMVDPRMLSLIAFCGLCMSGMWMRRKKRY